MTFKVFLAAVLVGFGAAMAAPAPPVLSAAESEATAVALAQSDLDEFMRQVLARRDENWKKLQQYVLDEKEKVEVIGPQLVRIMGTRREYRWFIKEGFFVRSPLSYDGVAEGGGILPAHFFGPSRPRTVGLQVSWDF